MAFTKRMSNRWQASATYLLSGQWNLQNAPIPPGCQYPITLTPPAAGLRRAGRAAPGDCREEWYLTGDQRHRVHVQRHLGRRPTASRSAACYFFGDNGLGDAELRRRRAADRQHAPAGSAPTARHRAQQLRPAVYHRVDMRVQRRFALGRARLDGIVEVFNVFNHANYGTFTTNESNSRFGQPTRT